ncbi:MAG: response regulator transcription factor [Magnetococcales bacterium]|nr:response regulator transcription factor [Magnetococcales bacterium]
MSEQKPVVFVIDDEQMIRDSLTWLMESVGLSVQAFSSGSEFLEAFDPKLHSCVLMDVRLPGMGGLELQEMLKSTECHSPIILMSGHADVPMAVRAMKQGAFDFLEKPFNEQQLLDLVQRALWEDTKLRQAMADATLYMSRYQRLSNREREVMEQIVAGLSNKEIAVQLDVSVKTVETHRGRVMTKMIAGSLAALVRMGMAIQETLARTNQGKS